MRKKIKKDLGFYIWLSYFVYFFAAWTYAGLHYGGIYGAFPGALLVLSTLLWFIVIIIISEILNAYPFETDSKDDLKEKEN